jgi:hypothetical protein
MSPIESLSNPSDLKVCESCWDHTYLYRNPHLIVANGGQHVTMMIHAIWLIALEQLATVLRGWLTALRPWLFLPHVFCRFWLFLPLLFCRVCLFSAHTLFRLFLSKKPVAGLSSTTSPPAFVDSAACDICLLRREAVQALGDVYRNRPDMDTAELKFADNFQGVDGHDVTVANLVCTKDEASNRSLELDITTPPGQDMSWLGYKQVMDTSDHSGSDECFDKIRSWMEDCLTNHVACLEPSRSDGSAIEGPARLIDTGPLSHNIRPRLVNWPGRENGGNPKYCALSYSWGQNTQLHFTTTAETHEQRRLGILMDQLPRTLQDAIVITRRVGCRYLWVCTSQLRN